MKYKLAAILCAALAGCGGGSSDPILVAPEVAVLPADATAVSALAGTSFGFPAGVPAFGTTDTTTLSLSGTAAAPGFGISSGGNTASGTMSFGSCVFVVSNSTFPAGHPMAVGATVTVNPCNIQTNTQRAAANGVQISAPVAMILGQATSTGSTVTVGVSASGQLLFNGNLAGRITLIPVSG